MGTHKFDGSKYEETKNLGRAAIAALIRRDLKAALPGFKFTVRTRQYSGGGSIDVEIVGVPAGFTVLGDLSTDVYPWASRRTDAAAKAFEVAKDIHDSYNFDDSDSQSDYFHCRYYGHVEWASELERAERAANAESICDTVAPAPVATKPVLSIVPGDQVVEKDGAVLEVVGAVVSADGKTVALTLRSMMGTVAADLQVGKKVRVLVGGDL